MTDAQIETVARLMCELMDLDPDEYLMCVWGDDMTAKERSFEREGFAPDLEIGVPRWRLFRAKAAEHIAAAKALEAIKS